MGSLVGGASVPPLPLRRGCAAHRARVQPGCEWVDVRDVSFGFSPRRIALFAVFVVHLFPLSAAADFYRYTDDTGKRHMVTDPDQVPARYRDQLRTVKTRPPAKRPPKHAAAPPTRARAPQPSQQAKTVEIFVTPWCGYCKKLERFLAAEGIAFTRYDIEKDRAAERRYKRLGGRGVPLTVIGKNTVTGYNPKRVLELLGRS